MSRALAGAQGSKPAIVVSIPVVWGVRNVIRSGLAERLATAFRVVFAVPEEGKADLLGEGVPEADTWVLERPRDARLRSWILQALQRAHRWRRPTATDDLVDRWNRGGRDARKVIRDAAFDAIGRVAKREALFARLERTEQDLFTRSISARVWEFLEATKPVFGLSTTCVVNWERPLFQAMRVLNIPTATHILSFDNVTSRGYVPLFKAFDHYLVWQERMAAELTRFYQVPRRRITITGTPQFDFHVDRGLCWSRERTAEVLGIDPRRPYIVYAANHYRFTPTEPELLGPVIRELRAEPILRDHQWVLRLHPMDQYARWEGVARDLPHVKLSHPWLHHDQTSYWGVPSRDEIAQLGNTLRHADAAVTIGSTIALDCAVVDTPVVCVGFHPDPAMSDGQRYGPGHWQHHFRPIMESGAAPLATDVAGLRRALVEAVQSRTTLREQRANLVKDVCGPVDGGAAERLAGAVFALVNGNGPSDGAEEASLCVSG